MKFRFPRIIAGFVVAAWAVSGEPVMAQMTAATKCEAGKGLEAGKFASCRHKADVRWIKTRGACSTNSAQRCYRDADCTVLTDTCVKDPTKYSDAINKCNIKFNGKWAKLEEKAGLGICPDGLAADDIRGIISSTVAEVSNLLAGGASGPRYVDNADGSISDTETGLMWEKKIQFGGGEDFTNLQDADNFYVWAGTCSLNSSKQCQSTPAAAAACLAGTQGSTDGCAVCVGGEGVCEIAIPAESTVWEWLVAMNNSNFAGHGDWRLPTLADLATLIDLTSTTSPIVDPAFMGMDCGTLCADLSDPNCSCTRSAFHWAATTFAFSPDRAWLLGFGQGTTSNDDKSNLSFIRAVRSGS